VTSQSARASATDDKIDAAQLKSMIEGLGYETKALNAEVGKEKYTFTVKLSDYDVPIAAELSASTTYVWLTVFLGASKPTAKFEDMLKRNYQIQPCQFYITTKGSLMMGVAIDNRQITPAVLKRNVDMLAENTTKSHEIWAGQ